jgi:hypothetical protein
MILRANTHNKSREWSRFDMIFNWRTIEGYRHVRSTWWIRGRLVNRSMTWMWSMFWSGDDI